MARSLCNPCEVKLSRPEMRRGKSSHLLLQKVSVFKVIFPGSKQQQLIVGDHETQGIQSLFGPHWSPPRSAILPSHLVRITKEDGEKQLLELLKQCSNEEGPSGSLRRLRIHGSHHSKLLLLNVEERGLNLLWKFGFQKYQLFDKMHRIFSSLYKIFTSRGNSKH